jgi:K+-transporting ATPase ATPase C chain
MKQHILPAIRLTLFSLVFFCGAYTLVVLGIAKFATNKGEGETIIANGRVVGYKLEGQSFTADKYFNGRPSAAGYNAAGSSGSNKGPSNPEYLKDVQNKIDTFLAHNPTIKKEDIPSDLITASGSGLDPEISPNAAYIQIARISKSRNINEASIKALVDAAVEKPILGIERVNVLKLNIELDKLK